MASSFKRTGGMRGITNLLFSTVRATWSPDWSNRSSDLCREEWQDRQWIFQFLLAEELSGVKSPDLTSFQSCSRDLWEMLFLLFFLGAAPRFHMPWRYLCFTTFIYFNLSNATLTEGTIHYFFLSPSLAQQRSEQKELSRCLNLASRCCVCLCEWGWAHIHFCVLDGDVKRKEASFGWLVKEYGSLDPATCWKCKDLPSTAAAEQQLIMTLFLTVAKGEDQSDREQRRRRHKGEKLTGNEYAGKSLSSSQSIVSRA